MDNDTVQYQIYKCTRCGKEFKDFKILITLSIDTFRLKETGIWETIPNLTQVSQDVLCRDCFDAFANILEKMNTPQSEEERINMENRSKHPLDGIEPIIAPETKTESCGCENNNITNTCKDDIINLVKIEEDVHYDNE
jgi:DNA-directed RNA polymerase subunit RPC12/RpoP